MKYFLIQIFFLFLVFPAATQAQHKNVSVAAEPAWVTHHEYNNASTSLDKYAEEGTIDLAYEMVLNIGEQAEYTHRTIKIISEAGVQNGSEVSVGFDPTYQHLIFHSLRIIRNNTPENKLNLQAMKVIQKEEDRNSFIYDGSLDAVSILEDVRVGDIIDYSYSTKGFNPIFKGKYASIFNTGFSMPIYNLYYKILLPQTRSIMVKNFNDTLQPVITTASNNKIYEWTKTDIIPLKSQDKTPSWYDPYPQFMVSEFASWKDVNDWAIKLVPK